MAIRKSKVASISLIKEDSIIVDIFENKQKNKYFFNNFLNREIRGIESFNINNIKYHSELHFLVKDRYNRKSYIRILEDQDIIFYISEINQILQDKDAEINRLKKIIKQ